jgi:hypothetical protein
MPAERRHVPLGQGSVWSQPDLFIIVSDRFSEYQNSESDKKERRLAPDRARASHASSCTHMWSQQHITKKSHPITITANHIITKITVLVFKNTSE